MDFSGAGTAIMLALAAVLWFLYLLPNWMRRREFLATERNATRLQRAIRVMAESAEAPEELRVEATARDVVRTERLLEQERRRADATARAELHAAELRARAAEAQAAELARVSRAATRGAPVAPPSAPAAFARLRRARRVAGLLLLAAVVVGAVQLWLMATTGVALGSWLVIGGCVVATVTSVRLQGRIAARARALAGEAPAAPARRSSALVDVATPPAAAPREWTPVPVPKPLYLERGEAPRVPVAPPASSEELLRAAREEAERALVAAHAEPEVVPFRRREPAAPAASAPPAPASAPSRFASMGIVEEAGSALPDLDEVLRRRRSG